MLDQSDRVDREDDDEVGSPRESMNESIIASSEEDLQPEHSIDIMEDVEIEHSINHDDHHSSEATNQLEEGLFGLSPFRDPSTMERKYIDSHSIIIDIAPLFRIPGEKVLWTQKVPPLSYLLSR